MPIKLRLVSPDSLPPELSKDIQIDAVDFHIGRTKPPVGPNDWYFPEDRNVSKKHATISYRSDGYYLVDHSTNGTYLQPVGQDKQHLRGSEARLAEGDRIWIGQYEIAVSIEIAGDATDTQATSFPPPEDDPVSSPLAPVIIQPLSEPEPRGELITPPGGPIIPDDLEWLPVASDNPPGPVEFISSVSKSLPDDIDLGVPEIAEPEGSVPSPPSSSDIVELEIPPDFNISDPTQETVEPEAPATVSPLPSSPVATTTTAPNVEIRPDTNALRAFLEGAGLNSDELAMDQLDPNLMKTLGTAFRRTLEGLIELLKGRAEFRHIYEAFEEDYTVFGPEQNNPLKHISYAQMALKTMLSQEKGFLPIDQAIEESLIDLKIHQFALIYSIRQGLNNTLRHFDPKEIEKQTPQHSGLSAMLTSKKSQHWDEFVKRYHQQNVNELLRQELVNGYLDYTKRLKKPLSKNKKKT